MGIKAKQAGRLTDRQTDRQTITENSMHKTDTDR